MTDRILITGSAGFVGKHLVTSLIESKRDCSIVATDIKPAPGWYEEYIGDQVEYIRGDITDEPFLSELDLPQFERIYHLAAIVGVSDYVQNPLKIVETNIVGTKKILERVKNSDVRFVFLSTSEIYGKNTSVPWDEKANRVLGPPTVDRWSYSTGKSACEHMIHGLSNGESPFTSTIIRPFNLYGPGQRPNFVIPAFINEVVNGNPPVVYDGGTQTRCFTYIADFIEGVISASTRPAGANEVFNLGSTRETRIRELAELVIDAADANIDPEFIDTDELYGSSYEDLDRRVPDVSKARTELNWKARTSLEAGIKKHLEWGRENYVNDGI
jgi:UDP-glucose 4-epimerase